MDIAECLDALAATVCRDDPRTAAQRRADATRALAAGVDRMSCQCGNPECPEVHIVAEQATGEGTSNKPEYLAGADELIPAELVAELAEQARVRPLFNPLDAPPEPGKVPSPKLAEFVRFRNATCRAPGWDVPASQCDIDLLIPHSEGGPTHASNLSCKCRSHDRLKTFIGPKVAVPVSH